MLTFSQGPRPRAYTLELPKELYRSRTPKVGKSKESLMFRFQNDYARLLAIAMLTFGAVCITALCAVF